MVTSLAHKEDDGDENDKDSMISFREVAWKRFNIGQASIPNGEIFSAWLSLEPSITEPRKSSEK